MTVRKAKVTPTKWQCQDEHPNQQTAPSPGLRTTRPHCLTPGEGPSPLCSLQGSRVAPGLTSPYQPRYLPPDRHSMYMHADLTYALHNQHIETHCTCQHGLSARDPHWARHWASHAAHTSLCVAPGPNEPRHFMPSSPFSLASCISHMFNPSHRLSAHLGGESCAPNTGIRRRLGGTPQLCSLGLRTLGVGSG